MNQRAQAVRAGPAAGPAKRRPGAAATGVAMLLAAVLCRTALADAPATAADSVTWTAQQVQAAGIRVQSLQAADYRLRITALASVQDPQAWLGAVSAFSQARASAAVAAAAYELARLHADQARSLYGAGQSIALAEVQKAEAALQVAQARKAASSAEVDLARSRLNAALGPALAHQVALDSRWVERLSSGKELLVALDLPSGQSLLPHATVHLLVPRAGEPEQEVPLKVFGLAGQSGTTAPGLRYFGVAQSRQQLMAGMRLVAQIGSPEALHAVWVPRDAVVIRSGHPVVFEVQHAPGASASQSFHARAVDTNLPWAGGYLQTRWSGLQIVTGGAGLLLTPPPSARVTKAATIGDGDDD